nr:MAG TPA: hypothetical protein [Caudoviricetes sp.]
MYTAVSYSPKKGGEADGTWALDEKVWRFLVCLLIVLWIMIYISPKAC